MESRGLANAKKDGGGKAWSQSINKQVDIFTQDVLRPVSTSDFELLATGKPLSLKEFSKGKSVRDLPCLVKVVAGLRSLCEYFSFGREQMFVVLEKKSMRVVTCKSHMDGSSYAVPLHTSFFHLVPYWMDTEGIRPSSCGRITANELLLSRVLPPVFAVVGEFEVNEHHSKKTVPVGTLLFPKEKKLLKDQRKWVLHTKSESGEMVLITPDCNGRFSILPCDARLSLQQALDHLKPPFTMRTVSDCDTMYVNVVTVENVHKEDVFIGMMKTTDGTSLDDIAAFSRIVEIPVSFNLTVVTMVPKRKEVLDQIYDFAHSKYHKVVCNPAKKPPVKATPGSVFMASNPAYIDISMASYQEELRVHPGSSTETALHTFTARERPNNPLQSLTSADPYLREEHIYDAISNYAALPIAIVHQKATLESESAETSLGSEPSHPSSIDKVSTADSIKNGNSVEESNIAYLKMMEKDDILHLLDAMNLSAYKEAFEQEQIDGETMTCLSPDMLIELGVSKSLHRLRLMKIISGQTSASSFITIPRLCSSS